MNQPSIRPWEKERLASQKSAKSRGGLRNKIIAWTFVPVAIILLSISLVMFMAYQSATEDLVLTRNQELVRLSAGQVLQEMDEYYNRLDVEARNLDIVSGDPALRQRTLEDAANRLVLFDAGTMIFDRFGTVVAADPPRPDLLGDDWSAEPFMRQMLLSPRSRVSNVVEQGPGQRNVVMLGVPIIGPRSEFAGTIVGMFSIGPESISSLYGDIVKLRLTRNGQAYLVDADGTVIYHSNPFLIGSDFSTQRAVIQVLGGETSALRTQNVNGESIVAAYAPIPSTPWALVTEEDWSVLSAASRNYQSFLILLLLLGLVTPTLVVVIGVRRITRPVQDLIAAAKAMASGNFNQQIITSSDDEIADLARQFNYMAGRLNESYSEMEGKVAERTKELAILNSLALSISQSLDIHTILSTALDEVVNALNFGLGVVYLRNPSTGVLEPSYEQGYTDAIRRAPKRGHLSEQVAKEGKSIGINDLSQNPSAYQALLEGGFRSAVSIPLLSKQQVLGVLSAASKTPREFQEQDLALLTSIGRQIGVAIDNARLYETEQYRAEQFRVINAVGSRIASILDVDTLLTEIAQQLQEAFDYYHVGVGLVEDGLVNYKSGAGPLWSGGHAAFFPNNLAVGKVGLSGWVAQRGESLMVPDVTQDERYVNLADSETKSELVLPIKVKGETIGVLDIQKDVINGFDDLETAVLQSLANQAGIAIENARLYSQARQLAALEERQRISRDLHDSVTQSLYGVTLYAEAAARMLDASQTETASTYLRLLKETSRDALAEMRLLIYELRPTILAEEGLVPAIHARLDAVEGRAGLKTTLSADEQIDLPSELEEEVYWIVHETLNNILKHAKAQNVSVTLQRDAEMNCLALMVKDDGVGFDVGSQNGSGGMGLRGMRERVNLFGGQLTLRSTPGDGTIVRALIPIDKTI